MGLEVKCPVVVPESVQNEQFESEKHLAYVYLRRFRIASPLTPYEPSDFAIWFYKELFTKYRIMSHAPLSRRGYAGTM
jgi:hypothetical protein